MTSLILIGVLSLSTTGYSQDYWSVYVPLHTTHFTSTHNLTKNGIKTGGTRPIGYHKGFLGSQGGQGGLLVSYNKFNKRENVKTHTIGFAQNSFGDLVGVASLGRVTEWKKIRFGFEAGVTYGYGPSYKRESKMLNKDKLGWLWTTAINTNFMPVITSTIGYNITKHIGIKALINPIYVNIGLNYQF